MFDKCDEFNLPPNHDPEKIPSLIKLVYNDDLDICKIHHYMRYYFAANKEKWEKYISDAKTILTEYKPLASNKVKNIMSFKNVKNTDIDKRIELIERYIDIIKRYIHVDAYDKKGRQVRCYCGRLWSNDYVEENGSKYRCLCGHSYYFMSKDISYNDCYKTQTNNNTYEDRTNFSKAIDRYCVRQKNKRISTTLFTELDEYFTAYGMKNGEYYRSLPKEKYIISECIGNKHGTNCALLFEALKETGNSNCYDDVIMIGHLYWGWTTPDIYKYIDIIMKIYDSTQIVYDSIPDKVRQSSLNVNTRLFFSLEFLDIPCNKEDFKLLDSKESNNEHMKMWKLMTENETVRNVKASWLEIR